MMKKSLMSCLRPKEVSNIIEATKRVADFIDGKNRFRIPSLAKKIGHSLNRAVTIALGKASEEEDKELIQTLEGFRTAFTIRWTAEISTLAVRTLRDKLFNAPRAYPVAEDMKNLMFSSKQTSNFS